MKLIVRSRPSDYTVLYTALALIGGVCLLSHAAIAQDTAQTGEKIVNTTCAVCHAAGVAGAPMIGKQEQWAARIEQGMDVMVENAIKGIRGMPPKGGNLALNSEQIRAAVEYMINPTDGDASKTNTTSAAPTPAANETKKVAPKAKVASVNTFSRLMKPTSQRNADPARDGIHDPGSAGTSVLQPPKDSFSQLPKGSSGNYVDWVKALEDGNINPRYDKDDPEKQPVIFDMKIIREVKGSMPDVVYPHKQHTQWLDCSNCHPAIFEPKKGANTISMAAIILGEKCGVCHGKVAFPVSDCRRCHSRKEKATIQNAASK